MRGLALLLAVPACGLPDEIGDYSLSIDVHAGTLGPLDDIVILGSDTPIIVGGELPTAPVTPAMLAANQPPPTDAQIYGRADVAFDTSTWPAGATEATLTSQDPAYTVFNTYGVVIGWRTVGGQRRFAVAELPPSSVAASNERDTLLEVTLVEDPSVEMWRSDCVRRIVGAQTRYVVSIGDYDCDGLYGAADCKPTTYCDPDATAGPAHDACVCT